MLFCVEFCQDMEGVKWNQYDLGQHLIDLLFSKPCSIQMRFKTCLADPKYKFCMGS